jgi:hypothetical protein
MIDDDEIRGMLEARAGSPGYRLTDVARAIATEHPRDGARPTLRLAFSFVAGTAVIAVLALIFVVLPGRSQRSLTPSSPPSMAATSRPLASASVTPAPVPWEALTWYSGDDGRFEQPRQNVFVQSVEYWRDAWIAVGMGSTSRAVTWRV